MRVPWLRLFGCLMLLCVLSPPAPRAELTAFQVPPGFVHMWGKGATPDPWGAIRPPGLICCPVNIDGGPREDGWPDFDVNPATNLGEVVWAYNESGDSEIAHVETLGTGGWGPISLLTSNSYNDLDPKIAFSSNGGTKIAYWREDSSQVYVIERTSPTGGWSAPNTVSGSGQSARYPSLVVAFGRVHVGYEIEDELGKAIVISGRNENAVGSPFVPEVIAHSAYVGKSEVILSSHGSKAWVSWVHSDSQVGYSRFNGSTWSTPQFKQYSDLDDIEAVRFEIRREMVGGND